MTCINFGAIDSYCLLYNTKTKDFRKSPTEAVDGKTEKERSAAEFCLNAAGVMPLFAPVVALLMGLCYNRLPAVGISHAAGTAVSVVMAVAGVGAALFFMKYVDEGSVKMYEAAGEPVTEEYAVKALPEIRMLVWGSVLLTLLAVVVFCTASICKTGRNILDMTLMPFIDGVVVAVMTGYFNPVVLMGAMRQLRKTYNIRGICHGYCRRRKDD